MGYAIPRTWAPGETPTAAHLNQDLRDNVSFLANPPRVRVRNNAVQSIANASWVSLTFNVEDYDTDGMHSTVSNTSRLTCVTAGCYEIGANAAIASNTTGWRGISLVVNNTTEIFQDPVPPVGSNYTGLHAFTEWPLIVGDYVEVRVHQTSGGALNTVQSGSWSPCFWMNWISL